MFCKSVVIFMIVCAPAAGAAVQWGESVGSMGCDFLYSVQATSDGGCVLAGATSSVGAGGTDAWCVKMDGQGKVEWQKSYGGPYNEAVASVRPTTDGGYVLAGHTTSFSLGAYDGWVVRLDDKGAIKWQRVFGGSGWDRLEGIEQTGDGGYIVAGWTSSFGAEGFDGWCLRLGPSGKAIWQRTFGGGLHDKIVSVQVTSDNGYLVAGETWSYGEGLSDGWCLKLDTDGAVVWQNVLGGTSNDSFADVRQTIDGGYVLTGWSRSWGSGGDDAWCVRLDPVGTMVWSKVYGDAGDERAYSIRETTDGGYVLAGQATASGDYYDDGWCLKLDAAGAIVWQSLYTGLNDGDDRVRAVAVASDGGYIAAGYTFTFGGGCADGLVLRLSKSGKVCAKLTKKPSTATARVSFPASVTSAPRTMDTSAEFRSSKARTSDVAVDAVSICK